jgi:hypothetical protein
MMDSGSCPLDYTAIVESYFLEHRAKLIDLAAFLDRLDRANDSTTDTTDFRVEALHKAIEILNDGDGARAKRVLESFSDMSTDIPQSAEGMKGALGAVQESTE